MEKINANNYDVALKLFKEEAMDSVDEFSEGMGDPEDLENFSQIKVMIEKAKDFEEVEEVLENEFGFEPDMISNEYQHTIARLVGMKKKEFFVTAAF